MERLRKQNSKLFNLLDQFATDQHNILLSFLLDKLTPYMAGDPKLLVLPQALDHLRSYEEAATDLAMRGKTPELVEFGGYTLVVPLNENFAFDKLYLTRPFTNKLKLTIFPKNPPITPLALWLVLAPNIPPPGPAGFTPQNAFQVHRGPAPLLPDYIKEPHEFITASVLLRESIEISPFNPQIENTLKKLISYPLEKEVGKRFFPPIQVVRSSADDILHPESYLIRLPMVPLLITHANEPIRTIIQLETVPSWPPSWQPEEIFFSSSKRVAIIGEGHEYNIPVLMELLRDISEATTASEDFYWPVSAD